MQILQVILVMGIHKFFKRSDVNIALNRQQINATAQDNRCSPLEQRLDIDPGQTLSVAGFRRSSPEALAGHVCCHQGS